MKYLISLYVWITGGFVFIFTLLWLIVATYFASSPKLDPMFKRLLRLIFKVIFVRVDVEGLEHLDKKQAYFFMPNHISFLDIPLTAGFIPFFIRGGEAAHHFKWPFYGRATRRYGNIPIDRSSATKSMESFERLKNYALAGNSVIIFPEGTRTRDGKLQKLKKMPFLMATKAGLPIVPVGISGMWELSPKGGWLIKPVPLKIKFGKPIAVNVPEGITADELAKITEEQLKMLIERP